jgi:DNA-binding transcriptional regulator YhcF (GntR family)
MSFSFDDKIPIYSQIMDIIKQGIVAGELKAGDKLLSMREMAEHYNVNPNTILRVYKELERENVTYTQRGTGTFITQDKTKIADIKHEMAVSIVKTFIDGMKRLGFTTTEAINILHEHIEKEMNNNG